MHARIDVNDALPEPDVGCPRSDTITVPSAPLRRRAWGVLFAATTAAWLAACGTKVVLPPPPPPPKPTIVNLELKAQDNLNPDLRGRPSPLLVRIYELATPAGFEALPFDALQADDTAGLKPDLVDKREQVIAPGATVASSLKPADAVKFIGVFASFRDLERARWRAVVPVKGNVTQRIELMFDDRTIKPQATVVPEPPPPPPALPKAK